MTIEQIRAERREGAEIGWRAVKAIRVEAAVCGDAGSWSRIIESRVDVEPVPAGEVTRWTSASW